MQTKQNQTDLLRLTTAGSVDDGKSTLIGRLFYDTKSIFEDQLQAIEYSSKQRGDDNLNLALLTDGLRAEREQSITIDVAYRYFETPRRKFIIADTPGHIQYTRNMVTGASTANLAIMLIDARKGMIEQTCRHVLIADLLGLQHVVLCINKMDLVDFSEDRFQEIVRTFKDFCSRLNHIVDITFIPISALKGDNVVRFSQKTPWYQGPTLLYQLETVYVRPDANHIDARFPVQWIIRPHSDAYHDFRGYSGQIAGGVFKPGDLVTVLPSGFNTRIKAIHLAEKTIEQAFYPLSVVLTFEDELDISHGDMIVKPNNPPRIGQDIEAIICWFYPQKLQTRTKYILRHTAKEVQAVVKKVSYKIDINTLHKIEDDLELSLNDIGRVSLRTSAPLFHDRYYRNRITGSFILIDAFTNETLAGGMIV